MITLKHSRICRQSHLLALALSALALGAGQGSADTTETTWTGGTSAAWATTGNWTGGTVPTSAISAEFSSAFTGTFQPTISTAVSAQGIWLASGVGKNVVISFGTGGTLALAGTATLDSNTNTALLLDDSGNHSLSIAVPITLGASTSFLVNNTGTLSLTSTLALASSSTLTLGGTNSSGAISIAGIISGTSGNILVTGADTVTLTKANTYTGSTTVESGTLVLGTTSASGAAGAAGNATTAIALGDATSISSNLSPTLLVSGTSNIGRNITVGSGNGATTGVYTIGGSSANTQTFSGAETLNQGLTVTELTGGTASFTGNITSGASGTQLITFNNAGSVSQTTGVIGGGTGTIAVAQTGAGATTLSGTNTYAGTTTITGGTLVATNFTNGGTAGSLGTSSNAAANLVINGGTLQFTSNVAAGSSSDRLFTLGASGGTLDSSISNVGVGLTFANAGAVAYSTANTAETLTLTGSKVVTNNNGTANYYTLFNPQITDNGSAATSVVKNGLGTWVIGGSSNTYSGGTTVNAGTIQFKNNGSYGSGPIAVASGATVALNVDDSLGGATSLGEFTSAQLDNFISANAAGFAAGSTLAFDPSDIAGSGASAGTNTDFYASNITLTNANLARVNNTAQNVANVANLVLSGKISLGTGGILVSSPDAGSSFAGGFTELSGNNTYTGATTLNGGNLIVDNANALGTFGGGAGTSGITITGQFQRLQTGTDISSFTVNAPISFAANTNTSSTLNLGGATNSIDGSANFIFGSTATITGGSVTTGTTTIGTTSSGSVAFNGNIFIDGGASGTQTLQFIPYNAQNIFQLNGVISDNTGTGSAVGSLSFGGASGTVQVNGANTYTGLTTVARGIVDISTFNSVATNSALGTVHSTSSSFGAPTSVAGGTISLGLTSFVTIVDNSAGETTDRVLNLAGTKGAGEGGAIENDGSGALVFTSNLTSTATYADTFGLQGSNTGANTFQGTISDGTGTALTSFTKAGAGTWTLGNAGSTYTGVTTISGGILKIAKLSNGGVASSIGSATNAAGNLIISGGTLQYTGTGDSTDRVVQIGVGTSAATGTIDSSGSGAITFSAAPTYGLANGARTLVLTGSNTGANTMSGLIANNGTATTSLTKSGAGTWVLGSANSFTGATTVNDGTLKAGIANAIGSGSAVTVNELTGATATLDLNGFNDTFTSLTFGGTGATATSTNIVTNSSGTSATLTLGGNVTTSATNNPLGATISVNTLDLGAGTRTFSVADSSNAAADLTVSSVIQNGTLTKTGAGTMVLSGANTYTGATSISAGAINYQNGTAFGGNSAITVASGATAQVQGGITGGSSALKISGAGAAGSTGALENVSGNNSYAGLVTLGAAATIASDTAGNSLSLTNTGTITGSGFGLTLAGSGNGSVASVIGTGAGTVTKSGSGTWTLSGANTYTGATTVSGGALSVAGSTSATSAVTVGGVSGGLSTATLSGTGTINGAVATLSTNTNVGQLAPGVNTSGNTGAAGKLTINGSLSIGDGTALDIDLSSSTAGGNDSIAMSSTGTLTFGSSLTININQLSGAGTLSTSSPYTLISGFSTTGGAPALPSSFTTIGATGYIATYSIVGNAFDVSFSMPSTTPAVAYWSGATSGSWATTSNFNTSTTSGTVVSGLPGTSTDVVFSTSTPTAANLSTTLDAATSINSLHFNSTSSNVTIASGTGGSASTLTLGATTTTGAGGVNTAPTGIALDSGAGTVAISAPVVLGANQAWSNASSSLLTVSGGVTGAHNLAFNANSTGGITLSGGSVNNGGSITNSGSGTGYTTISSNIGSNVTSVTQNSGTSAMVLTGTNNYTGGTSVLAGKLYVSGGSGANTPTSTGPISVTGSTSILAAQGAIGGAVTLSSGGSLYSGGTAGTPVAASVPGAGTTSGATLSSALSVNGGNLTFALNVSNVPGATLANPNTSTSFITTSSSVSFTGSDSITLVDLSNGSLNLRMNAPYLLISASSDSMFTGLVTVDSTGHIGLDQNGYVLGVQTGGTGTVNDPYTYTALTINEYGADGVTPLSNINGRDQTYLTPQFVLNNGELEVVPEPGTWALMLGGLALLVVIQRRRASRS